MKCPSCGEKIDRVVIFFEVVQDALLAGKNICEYACEENKTVKRIECPECSANISTHVKI